MPEPPTPTSKATAKMITPPRNRPKQAPRKRSATPRPAARMSSLNNQRTSATTIKMLTGILMPTEGRVVINGYDMREKPMEAKQSMGYIADNPDIFLRLTGLEYVNFIADIYGVSVSDRKARIEQMAERFVM